MVELGPELVPEGVTLAEALPILLRLAPFIVALGFIVFIDGFTRALLGTAEGAVSWVPVVGKWAKKPIHQVEQKITNILGTAERKLDGYIAHSFHQLGVLTRQLGRQVEGLALDLYHLSHLFTGLLTPQALTRYVKALLHPVRTAEAILRKLVAVLHHAERILHHAYVDVLLPRVHGAEHAIGQVIYPDIAALRRREKALERKSAREFKWIRSRPWLIASAAMTATVALCLRRLGLGWLRCRNVGKVGKRLCGLPASLLDDLLGLAFAFGVLVDPEEIARLALDVEEPIEKLVRKILA